jgi:AAA+ ATPase superfamily predicted ATPase
MVPPPPSTGDFVGRHQELERLGRMLEAVRRSGRGGFVSIRGRRRVGKSRLVDELTRRAGCPSVFYTATQADSGREVDRFLEAIARSDLPAASDVRAGVRADGWEAALELAVRGATRERPSIVVIDEFPYLAEKDPSIESVLQLVWDRQIQELPVLLVLIGSDRAVMDALSEHGRPLYDRPREMVVAPLSPADVAALLDLPPAEALDAYVVIGGFPVLALEWGAGRTRDEYLAEALTDPTSFLVVSGERALAAEFQQEAHARAVLGAIGADAIAQRTGLSATTLARAFEILDRKGAIERVTPYSANPTPKNRRYRVADPYLRFWLRFVGPYIDEIERGRGSVLLDRLAGAWTTYRGKAIEPIVAESMERMLPDARFGGAARHIGSYWTRNGAVEVDLVGGNATPVADEIAFLGSIKWRDSGPFTGADAAALAAQRAAVPGATEATRLVGASRNGFERVAGLDVQLGPDDILAAYRPAKTPSSNRPSPHCSR